MGRTGTCTIGAAGSSREQVQLPLSVLDLPTLLESYRTIDGKSGDYIKTADVSQASSAHPR